MDAVAENSSVATPLLRPVEIIKNALSLLIEQDSIFEIRAIGCSTSDYRRSHDRGGFFDAQHLVEAAQAAFTLSSSAKAGAAYFTLNPLRPEVLARRCNRVDVMKQNEGAADRDILKRRWMLIDCDPNRPSGISSTDAEKEAAKFKALEVRNFLAGRHWPDPILCDSGNGWHLLYRIDLPNTEEGKLTVKRCLRTLAGLFDSAEVSIDTSVFNAARVCKLYGTKSRKGDSTPDRPHRVSGIIKGPTEKFAVVDELQLIALAAEAPAEKTPSGKRKKDSPAVGQSVGERAAKYLENMPESIAGQHGHDKAYRAACMLVRGFNLTPEAAFPILWEWNSRCEPPWNERELQHKLEDASVNADGEAGYLLYAPRPDADGRPNYSENEFLPFDDVLAPPPLSKPEAAKNEKTSFDFDLDSLPDDVPFSVSPPPPSLMTKSPGAKHVLPPLPAWARKNVLTPDESLAVESDDDPHRLARVFLRSFTAADYATGQQVVTLRWWREVFHAYNGRRYVEISDQQIKADITKSIKEEFDGITILRSQEASRDPTKPAPVTKKVGAELVSSVMNVVKSITILSDATEQPAWLDGRHGGNKSRDFISVENGILDVAKLLDDDRQDDDYLLPHSPFWFCTSCVPYPYDPTATCPLWDKFLATNLQENEDQIRQLQEWFGYCLTHDTSQQKFLMMEGRGRNGKSVICAALTALLGQENVSSVPLEAFEKETNLVQTIGRLANIVPEIGEVDRVAEGVLKSFTSGDRMMFRRLYKNPFEAYPTARLVFATNNRPRFNDRSDGLWRRMILLTLTYQVPDDERVFGMDRATYWQHELAGMLNWALAGLWELRRYGRFTVCETSKDDIEDYRTDVNPTRQFLLEHFEWGGDTQWVPSGDAYEAYKSWCEHGGFKVVNIRNFGKEIQSVWPKVVRRKGGTRENRFWCYEGLMRKTDLINEFLEFQ